MAEKLSAEQRKKVAEACGKGHMFWAPQHKGQYWVALIAKTAQLIRIQNDLYISLEKPTVQGLMAICAMWERLGRAIADGNTDGIELLCHELLEAQ